jgi:hypothetical protein
MHIRRAALVCAIYILRPLARAATGEGRLAGERKRVIKPYANISYNYTT